MIQADFEAMLADETKQIVGDIEWSADEDRTPAVEFRVEVASAPGYPIFVKGRFNRMARSLTFALIHRGSGRVYGLDMGKDHHNPTCTNVGEIHKHRWLESVRDKDAYLPPDITASAMDPRLVWQQFCAEAAIQHKGQIHQPPATQSDLP